MIVLRAREGAFPTTAGSHGVMSKNFSRVALNVCESGSAVTALALSQMARIGREVAPDVHGHLISLLYGSGALSTRHRLGQR